MGGFIDLQVNGYAGVDFQSPDLSLDKIHLVSRTLFEKGTCGYLATVVTASRETYQRALPVLAQAVREGDSRRRLLGVHLEGPFISDQDGAVGAHPKSCVAPCDPAFLDELIDWSEGTVKVLTVAPERPGALDLIRHACERGIVVSLGHSLANCEQYAAAVEAGAKLATHVGNGIPQQIARQDTPITACLGNHDLTAMIITDGHHLIDPFIKMVLYAKGTEHTIVTSDSAPVAGLKPGDYTCFGSPARLEPNGYLRNLAAPGLAGSSCCLLECLNYLAALLKEDFAIPPLVDIHENRFFNQSLVEFLWRIGFHNAADLIGINPDSDVDDPGFFFDDERFSTGVGWIRR